MGIYDNYQAPNVACPHAPRTTVPEHSRLATMSIQIARTCLRCYLVVAIATALILRFATEVPLLHAILPRTLLTAAVAALLVHFIGFAIAWVGLFQPARKRGRALWGLLLNVALPTCLLAVVLFGTLPLLSYL